MATWNGPTPGLTSMGGSVLPGLIVMTLQGRDMLESSTEVQHHFRWFIAHEAAHFWLGQTLRYERMRDMWITEGGADLMAIRALQDLMPNYDPLPVLQEAIDDCIALSHRQNISDAAARSEHRAYYACGAVFGLIAESVQSRRDGGDFFDFLRPLIEAGRSDGVLIRTMWLDALSRISGDPTLAANIETLLDEGAADPAFTIASLFRRTGVPHEVEGGGVRVR